MKRLLSALFQAWKKELHFIFRIFQLFRLEFCCRLLNSLRVPVGIQLPLFLFTDNLRKRIKMYNKFKTQFKILLESFILISISFWEKKKLLYTSEYIGHIENSGRFFSFSKKNSLRFWKKYFKKFRSHMILRKGIANICQQTRYSDEERRFMFKIIRAI